ncbi:hypothetical protein FAZ15_17225 [Sphingobacterium olei]|uniref:DUF4369 domain-containing protein n=1 Tax=Sphingobacterium olei TaxID=2571155 RepID=A0A4U0NHS8_9SPHI|nr:hypothetical protein [Sphingobacterium olei]TJZ53766.1 hypothetical protein FAZ15_17225 [Sphingobacterium olei]
MKAYTLYTLSFLLILSSCHTKESKHKEGEIHVLFQNLPVDSCSVRVHHIITGKEVFSLSAASLDKPIAMPALEDDMYIAVLSWPRTLISHSVFYSRSFNAQQDQDFFELTKPLLLHKKHGSNYVILTENRVSIEEIEADGAEILKFKNIDCAECDLADEYWRLFGSFFKRKQLLLDSLKGTYYSHIESSDLSKGRDAFLKLEDVKTNYLKDDVLDRQVEQMVVRYPTSSVSTFFLFYQLYNHREFAKFHSAYKALRGDALKSKYYDMVQNQYEE